VERLLPWLAGAQAVYFVVTGVWPLVSIRTFMAVTGPKSDIWLVKTVGLLVTVIGAAIGIAAWNDRFTPEVFVLAVGSAAALGAVDVYYHLRGVIARIYLLDAVAEAVLIVAWCVLWFGTPSR
jgi:uncharacterized membrane protein